MSHNTALPFFCNDKYVFFIIQPSKIVCTDLYSSAARLMAMRHGVRFYIYIWEKIKELFSKK